MPSRLKADSLNSGELITPSDEEDAEITAAAETDPDNPIWSDEDFARARPAWEVVPELVEAQRRRGYPPSADRQVATTIRLSTDILAHFRAAGPGWETRINETLRKAMEISDLSRPD